MKLCYKYLFILLLSLSCKNKEERYIPTKAEQLEFLRVISNDTTIFSKYYENAFVFEKRFFNSEKPLSENGKTKWVSEVELITKYLNVGDTMFVHNQIHSDSINSIDLMKAGFKTVNYDKLIHRSYIGDSLIEKKLVSQDSLDKVFNLIEKHKYIQILKPIFNESLNLAFIQVDYKEYSGSSLIYKKKGNNWVLEKEVSRWMR